jgi:predicted Fe-Mo cluster-binding NifX family protein
MKLAISITGNTLDSSFDSRFGRAAAFCIVDTETGQWQVFENPALSASGGAGVQASQFIAKRGVQAVASGAFGPNAFDLLSAAEIDMYLCPIDKEYTAEDILAMYKDNQLSQAETATHAGHHGGRH